jgi:phosphatidylserine decarboxylase
MKNVKTSFFPPLHKEGVKFVLISGIAALFFICLGNPIISLIALCFTGFCYFFFRDPYRTIPVSKDYIISPADGIITFIGYGTPPNELVYGEKEEMMKVSIFLSPFDVHVNRAPMEGEIIELKYNPGKFINASLDKSSDQNERQSMVLKSEDNVYIVCVQIAGFIARRIVCDVKTGDKLSIGQKYGIIRFGSRADVYIPKHLGILVGVGQKVVGGETIISDIKNNISREFVYENPMQNL